MTRSQLLVSTDRAGAEPSAGAPRYSLLVAYDNDEVVAAQRLRHQVFAEEMGATLHSPRPGLDADAFDEFCDHLVVRDDDSGAIVGTYRMLPPERAAAAGRLYADTEFDLTALAGLRPSLVETGRSCVHPDHRTGAVVGLVWAGIARYMLLSGHRYLAGCASVPLTDGGALAAGVWDTVRTKHFAPPDQRVAPLHPWDPTNVVRQPRTALPPLLKGYLRLGAVVCGPPAHDPEFGVADFFVLLDLPTVDQRYLKFFLGTAT
ncbi:Putative hemolysin [Amycolatopsis arida]|uniref:Putative hemolysin n=1 Tax=Amycolatopsis arida TaxID=587909 RepID=A0A1I5P5I9_9PSEU|nr:GNAT family N-acyltransferase [Amycolatopsis arida]TDX98365.1 putative hemolysin [Amycolatopsis arida]SFP29217.1 Putative hemolysin [Amycolatopsis arida]